MHFTQREQAALREAGLTQSEIETASSAVVEATADAAATVAEFFAGHETVYSDMEMAHSASAVQEHSLEWVDCYTHADDIRGYIRFDTWGVPIEGARVLADEVVELSLGPTINDRIRFAAERDAL
jgi:hypothetical protein